MTFGGERLRGGGGLAADVAICGLLSANLRSKMGLNST